MTCRETEKEFQLQEFLQFFRSDFYQRCTFSATVTAGSWKPFQKNPDVLLLKSSCRSEMTQNWFYTFRSWANVHPSACRGKATPHISKQKDFIWKNKQFTHHKFFLMLSFRLFRKGTGFRNVLKQNFRP